MKHLTSLLLSLVLTTAVASAWAAPVVETMGVGTETAEVPSGVVAGLGSDASAEAQAERDVLVAQWEADALVAGVDPATADASTE